jgi:hypothetical protein
MMERALAGHPIIQLADRRAMSRWRCFARLHLNQFGDLRIYKSSYLTPPLQNVGPPLSPLGHPPVKMYALGIKSMDIRGHEAHSQNSYSHTTLQLAEDRANLVLHIR